MAIAVSYSELALHSSIPDNLGHSHKKKKKTRALSVEKLNKNYVGAIQMTFFLFALCSLNFVFLTALKM